MSDRKAPARGIAAGIAISFSLIAAGDSAFAKVVNCNTCWSYCKSTGHNVVETYQCSSDCKARCVTDTKPKSKRSTRPNADATTEKKRPQEASPHSVFLDNSAVS